MATTAPPTATRFLELDALRGFAVMGILAMNIMAFSMPEMAYFSPEVYGGSDPHDVAAWYTAFILVDGKMRGLFSLLFGASTLIVAQSAEASGKDAPLVHYSRMMWLALFGLFHFFFIWWGDILFLYAACGCIAFLFHNMQPKNLIIMALILYTIGFLLFSLFMGSMFFLEMAGTGSDADPAMQQAYQDMMRDLGVTPAAIAENVALYSGSYAGIVTHNFTEEWMTPLVGPLVNGLETIPLMLLGMALCKTGFLLGQAEPARYRKWMLIGLGLGGLGFAGIGWLVINSGFDIIFAMNAGMAWTYPFRLLMTIGYVCAFIMLVQKFVGSGFIARVAAAGRAAFTNYLGTSIVMTFIFYGWGLGLYGSVGRAEVYLFVLGMWILMLLWSKPWLERFRYGPLEWLWRSLARWESQPMRK